MPKSQTPEEWWRRLLTGDNPDLPIRQLRRLWARLPSGPRCKFCNAPYHAWGGSIMRVVGKGPSRLTPELCQQCQSYASRYLGGAEIETTLLFADVRGSTTLAETMSPLEFSRLISRFFAVASDILVRSHALVDRLVGDQVVGIYVPGFAGSEHKQQAFEAARHLLRATGHGASENPWIAIGIGLHSGSAFVGAVGSEQGATDITVLGDTPNIAARLASSAAAGEILISQDALVSELLPGPDEVRQLTLKGKSQPVIVHVAKV